MVQLQGLNITYSKEMMQLLQLKYELQQINNVAAFVQIDTDLPFWQPLDSWFGVSTSSFCKRCWLALVIRPLSKSP